MVKPKNNQKKDPKKKAVPRKRTRKPAVKAKVVAKKNPIEEKEDISTKVAKEDKDVMESVLGEMGDDEMASGAAPRVSPGGVAPGANPSLAKKPIPESQKDAGEAEAKFAEKEKDLSIKAKELDESEEKLKNMEKVLEGRKKLLEAKAKELDNAEAALVNVVADADAPDALDVNVGDVGDEDPEKNDLSFFDRASSGELIFSNRTHYELVFSDLGFPSPGHKFDPLIFKPYQERDLEVEGFTSEQVIMSKNLRNFIAAGKMKQGPLAEKDKLPENTKFAAVRNLGQDVTILGIKFTGHYLKLYTDFVAKEKLRCTRTEG